MRFRSVAYIAIFVVGLCYCRPLVAIRNYEDSRHLRLAKKHCPTFADDRELVDRDKAIQHYLAYLREYPDTFNRPKVLTQIGCLYAQYRDPESGVETNYEKAKPYFKKAIEAAPELVCWDTIIARTNLASLTERGAPRVEARIKAYKWIHTRTAQQIRDSVQAEMEQGGGITWHWPPGLSEAAKQEAKRALRGGVREMHRKTQQRQIEHRVSTLQEQIEAVKGVQATNMVADAAGSETPVFCLSKIVKELPGTGAAKKARKKLREIGAENIPPPHEALVKSSWQESPSTLQVEGSEESSLETTNRPASIPAPSRQPTGEKTTGEWEPWLFGIAGGFLGAAISVAAVVVWRRKKVGA